VARTDGRIRGYGGADGCGPSDGACPKGGAGGWSRCRSSRRSSRSSSFSCPSIVSRPRTAGPLREASLGGVGYV